jgi:hypothetical protein
VITTDSFTFVHLPKCGGSFVSRFLLRFLPSARRVGYHYPAAAIPPDRMDNPVLGCVRDPWSFYVSYYWFQKEVLASARERVAALPAPELAAWTAAGNDPFNGVDALFEEASDGGVLGFAATTRRLLDLGTDDRLLDRVLAALPVAFDRRHRSAPVQRDGFRGMNVRAADLAAVRGTGAGLFTFLFRHMYAGVTERSGSAASRASGPGTFAEPEFLRLERLREDLPAYLERRGVPVTGPMTRFLRDAGPVNASRHDPYPRYYDAALAALVAERDGGLADRFGYRFDRRAGTVASAR